MAIRQPVPPRRSPFHGRRMSRDEFLALPEEKPYLEYINGVVEQKPVVNANHGRIVGRLDGWFFMYAREHGGDLGPERRVALESSGDFYLPDTAFWAHDWPSGDDTAPTVAVEVRSPRQSLSSLRDKCRGYLRDGSAAAWLFDPEARTVEVFEGGGMVRVLHENDTLTCRELPGLEISLAEIFAPR